MKTENFTQVPGCASPSKSIPQSQREHSAESFPCPRCVSLLLPSEIIPLWWSSDQNDLTVCHPHHVLRSLVGFWWSASARGSSSFRASDSCFRLNLQKVKRWRCIFIFLCSNLLFLPYCITCHLKDHRLVSGYRIVVSFYATDLSSGLYDPNYWDFVTSFCLLLMPFLTWGYQFDSATFNRSFRR